MKKISVFVFILLGISSMLGAQGIEFQKLDWKENLKKAQAENKIIYVDFFTTWCAPCTFMAKKYFSDAQAGKFYNKNFYCLKLDAEKEGLELAKQYNVNGYPTNLFINPANENIVFKTMGAPGDLTAFIANGETAVEEFKDTLTLERYAERMEQGDSSKEFTLRYLKKLTRLDLPNQWPLDVYSSLFFKKKLDSTEFQFMDIYLKDINNNTFQIFKNNKQVFNAYLKQKGASYTWKDVATSKIHTTNSAAALSQDGKLYRYCMNAAKDLLPENDAMSATYFLTKTFYEGHDSLQHIKNEYDYADKLVTASDKFYKEKNAEMLQSVLKQLEWQSNEWPPNMVSKLDSFKQAFSQNPEYNKSMHGLAAAHLNSQAWFVFENDPDRYPEAEVWAAKGYEFAKKSGQAVAATADTYANLLFKNGKKKMAIKIETEAIKKAEEDGEDTSGYEETLKTFE